MRKKLYGRDRENVRDIRAAKVSKARVQKNLELSGLELNDCILVLKQGQVDKR